MEWIAGLGLLGLLLALLVLVLDVVAIISAIQSSLDPVMKLIWVVVIIALPVLGMVLWFLVGTKMRGSTV